MKICEYENVRCPFCGEEDRLQEMARCEIKPSAGMGIPAHGLHCLCCSGDFAIACLD